MRQCLSAVMSLAGATGDATAAGVSAALLHVMLSVSAAGVSGASCFCFLAQTYEFVGVPMYNSCMFCLALRHVWTCIPNRVKLLVIPNIKFFDDGFYFIFVDPLL